MHANPEPTLRPRLAAIDFDRTPFVAIWETTRACDLACRHCRAEAMPDPDPRELTTREGTALLDDLAEMGTPICVLSGGDPAKRADLLDLVRHGSRAGMQMATIPAATPRLTRRLVEGLKEAGLAQMALSLDGPAPEIHDSFRQTPGAFDLTLQGACWAREVGLPLQINTTFSSFNREQFDAMARMVRDLGVVFWEVFFLVPMGRGRDLGQMTAQQFESLFARLAHLAGQVEFIIKVVEAPHFRRYLMQHPVERKGGPPAGTNGHGHGAPATPGMPANLTRDIRGKGPIGLASRGVNAGNGHLFVSHLGDVCPSGFLPLSCGNVRADSVARIYRRHPVFRQLRNPALLKGRCGICEYSRVCGGSRARAYAMTGDYLAEEPLCVYHPRPSAAP
jgi:radical SAM protein